MAATKPRVRPDVAVAVLDGESVVYVPDEDRFHFLNHPASIVFALCDGTATVREMAEAIADVYEMPVEAVQGEVKRLVRNFRSSDLLEATVARPTGARPVDDARAEIRLQVPHST